MEDVDRANEAMEADEGGEVGSDSSSDDEEDDSDSDDSNSEDDDYDDSDDDADAYTDSDISDDNSDDGSDSEDGFGFFPEEDVPTPEEVELEYTYPRDFHGRRWKKRRRYFRLIIDPACIQISGYKFKECEYLIEIVYPEGQESKLLKIGYQAFMYCPNLQRMNPFPEGLIELGGYAFDECYKLQGRLTIPSSIRYVRGKCFATCPAITSVVFESSAAATTTMVALENELFFYCEGLRSVRLPNNLTIIPMGCFIGCRLLLDAPIPETVHTIQSRAFEMCLALRAVDLPESVVAMDEKAYFGCSSLVSVTIRSSMNAVQQHPQHLTWEEQLNYNQPGTESKEYTVVGRNVFGQCPSLDTIRVVNPLVWSQVLSAMNTDPSFLYRFVRKYEDQIMTHQRSS